MTELEQEQRRETFRYNLFRKGLDAARRKYDESEQDYRFFVINRAYREGWKPWTICGAVDMTGTADDPQCQLPQGHDGRWHQEWSKDGRLLAEWSGGTGA